MKSFPFLTFYLLLPFHVLKLLFAADFITPTQPLKDGETLISASQSFELGFFSRGNSKNRYMGIWYKKSPETVAWVANRNSPVTDLYGVLTIGNDGNLVILNQEKNVIWSSNVSAIITDHPLAQLLDSGNLVLMRDQNGSTGSESYQWQSFDHPSDTLVPGMKLGWNLKSGQERTLTSWRSTEDPSPGDWTYSLDINGLPQLFVATGSVKKIRAGPWNGLFFSGIPNLQSSEFEPVLVQNDNEIYYTYRLLNSSAIIRSTMNQSGSLALFQMYGWNSEWTTLYSLPVDGCDYYGQCGANTICTASSKRYCDCLKGFVSNSSQGQLDTQNLFGNEKCERKLTLDCQREEGFLKIGRTKLPDLLEFRLVESLNLKECETECLKNCSCAAYTNSNITGTGSGCIMWFGDLMDIREQSRTPGQDIYIRVPTSVLESLHDSSRKKRRKTILAASISSTSGILIPALVLICMVWKKTKRKGMKSEDEDMEVPLFNFGTIATATNNFSPSNILGSGGFGSVYKGKLLSGQEVAVKKLSKSSRQGVDEFRNEAVLIAKLKHRNLVGLLGCCTEGEERMLIYEYMPNKSLDYFIFDQKRSVLLAWKERFIIILGIARGLLYLHRDSKLRIVHRDLKPSNILLDSDMKPKISDFGLARISGDDDGKEEKTRRVVGTHGYISPEYAINGKFSVKSDVFSFGVLTLEILSGRKNRGFTHPDHNHNLLGHAWLLWNEGRVLELMDANLEDSHVKSQVLRCFHVGLLCVQEVSEDRPAMSSVVFMLANEGAILPQPKQPGFFMERSSVIDATPKKEENYTENRVSTSKLEGR